MGLNLPTNAGQIFNRIAVDIVNELNELDPFLRNSLLRALSVSFSNAFFEIYKTLEQLEKLTFWDTTEGDSLERWAAIFGIVRNPETIASGFVTLTGIASSTIPTGKALSGSNGQVYETTEDGLIETNVLSVDSIIRVGQIATVTTSLDHGLASNISVTMAGSDQTEYNGDFVINVTSLNEFEIDVLGSPTTPATGTITATASYDNISVQSVGFGADKNLNSGSSITLSSPEIGVDNVGYVSFDEVSGGTDLESDEGFRDRFLFRVQNPIALFNENAIIDQARTVSGVTRVFVQTVDTLTDSVSAASLTRYGDLAVFETATGHGLFDGQVVSISGATESDYNVSSAKILVIDPTKFAYVVQNSPTTPATGSPLAYFSIASLGQVRVFFTRDNDDNIIPTPSEVDAVKNSLLQIKPAPLSKTDLIVSSPTPVFVPFTFSSLVPNTQSMQAAIRNNLKAFFLSNTAVNKDLTKLDYESVINSTIDSGGNIVESFSLITPTADIPIGNNELPVIGTVTF